MCTQLPVLMLLVSQHGVQSWCHSVQVGDDRPVLETRCALLSCSPGVVWALFVFPFSNGRYPDNLTNFARRLISRYFGGGWLSGFSVTGSLTQAGEISPFSSSNIFCWSVCICGLSRINLRHIHQLMLFVSPNIMICVAQGGNNAFASNQDSSRRGQPQSVQARFIL